MLKEKITAALRIDPKGSMPMPADPEEEMKKRPPAGKAIQPLSNLEYTGLIAGRRNETKKGRPIPTTYVVFDKTLDPVTMLRLAAVEPVRTVLICSSYSAESTKGKSYIYSYTGFRRDLLPAGWITGEHVRELIQYVDSTHPASPIVTVNCSNAPSTLGIQAMLMIELFRSNTCFLYDSLDSEISKYQDKFTRVNQNELAKEYRNWWNWIYEHEPGSEG